MTEQMTIFSAMPAPKTYDGQRVVTLRDIDEIHQRAEGTAWKNFYNNRKHFVEGTDFFHVMPEEVQTGKVYRFEIGKRGTYVFTLTGYLMIVKSFTDDLSWAIQRELVTGYFGGRKQGKTFMGTPVVTLDDYCEATGCARPTMQAKVRKHYQKGDFPLGTVLYLEGVNLRLFKDENPECDGNFSALYILTREGAQRLTEIHQRRGALKA